MLPKKTKSSETDDLLQEARKNLTAKVPDTGRIDGYKHISIGRGGKGSVVGMRKPSEKAIEIHNKYFNS